MIHLYRFEPFTLHVPPEGNPFGKKYLHGDWACVMCRGLLSFHAHFNSDHGDDCPGKENT
jgi:hypothetical protein